jgi:8-oxo-dGTP pyrophosphatase MutT (NUDIX family)
VKLVGAGDPSLAPSPDLGSVVDLLTQHREETTRSEVVDEMLRFAATHDDALHRSCEAGHFTGSAAVVDAAGERVMVMHHNKAGRWLQPGGHADGDGNLAGVALRESWEETGLDGLSIWPVPIDVDIHQVRFPDAPPHLHLDVRFVVRAPAGAVATGNDESAAVRWVTIDELATLDTDGSVLRLCTRALELVGGDGPGRSVAPGSR